MSETKKKSENEMERLDKENNMPEGDGWLNTRPKASEAYFRVKEGAKVQGELLGRFPKTGGRDGFIYQIRSTKECEASVRISQGEYEDKLVPEGTIISVDEKTALEGLRELCNDPDERYEVCIKAVEKQKLDKGRSFWNMTVHHRKMAVPF